MVGIDLVLEKNKTISTKDAYDLVDAAIKTATIEGYVNSFVLTRVALLFMATILYPDLEKDILDTVNNEDILTAWDTYVENGLMEKLNSEYDTDVAFISEVMEQWSKDYNEYKQSIGNIIDNLDSVMSSVSNELTNNFSQAVDQTGVGNVIEIADKWGMNNELAKENIQEENEQESLIK